MPHRPTVSLVLLAIWAAWLASFGTAAAAAAASAEGHAGRHSTDRRSSEHSQKAAADERVEKLLRALTPEEKIDLISGTGFATHAIARLGIPALRMSDGPVGVRSPGPSTAYAAGIALAASWNPLLAERIGTQIGRDARSRGLQFVLGPGANLYRAPMNGRNFEYLGEDPFLASSVAVGYIEGLQSERVSATIKHFAGNESEYARHTADSRIDERTLREIYLPVFEAAVKQAHTGAVMSSYNLLNGQHTTENAMLVERILKGDWGFGGVFMSDWSATYNGVAAANAGLDLEMPSGRFMNPATLLPAIRVGKVSQSTIDDKVKRLLRLAERFGWMDEHAADASIPSYNQEGRVVARESALESAVLLRNAGGVLPFDLERIHNIAVIGPDAYPAVTSGGGSGHVTAFAPVSVLQGLSDELGARATVTYDRGIQPPKILGLLTPFTTAKDGGGNGVLVESFADDTFTGTPRSSRIQRSFTSGSQGFGGDPDLFTMLDVLPAQRIAALRAPLADRTDAPAFQRWSAWYRADSAGPYTVFVQDTGRYRLTVDGQVVIDSALIPKAILRQVTRELAAGAHRIVLEQISAADVGPAFLRVGISRPSDFVTATAKALAKRADAVVIAVGFDPDLESEGGDREFALPPGQEELIREIATINPNTVVIVTSGGAVDAEPWVGSVKALIESWYPGQEGGAALAQILTGAANPSGRLPISWERAQADNPAAASYYYDDPAHPDAVVYREGIFVGYRGYQHNGVQPLFPFGFGLSYTTFRYSGLQVSPASVEGAAASAARKPLYQVSFDVTNTGSRAGADVGQIYVGAISPRVPRPVRELKGFARIELQPGETRHVSVQLDARAFAYYDVQRAQWRADAGNYRIELGRSAQDIQAVQKLRLPQTLKVSVRD